MPHTFEIPPPSDIDLAWFERRQLMRARVQSIAAPRHAALAIAKLVIETLSASPFERLHAQPLRVSLLPSGPRAATPPAGPFGPQYRTDMETLAQIFERAELAFTTPPPAPGLVDELAYDRSPLPANLLAAQIFARRFPKWGIEDVLPHEAAEVLRCACESPAEEWLPICAHRAYDLLEYARASPDNVLACLDRWRTPHGSEG